MLRRDGHVASEAGGCLVYDGENGIGQVIAEQCCEHAIRLGKTHGIAMVVARESNHFGAAAFWAQRLSRAGLLGMVMCNASPLVAPWQGKEPAPRDQSDLRVGPGPSNLAARHGHHYGRRRQDLPGPLQPSARHSRRLGHGCRRCAHHQHGNRHNGLLMPLGGYKGSGLAMLVEVFCAVLGGGAMSTQLGGIRVFGQPARVGQSFWRSTSPASCRPRNLTPAWRTWSL